jgi:hypothetical protein
MGRQNQDTDKEMVEGRWRQSQHLFILVYSSMRSHFPQSICLSPELQSCLPLPTLVLNAGKNETSTSQESSQRPALEQELSSL